jgi:hypothetical protein
MQKQFFLKELGRKQKKNLVFFIMQNVVSLEFHKHHSPKTNQISSQSNQGQPKIIMHNPMT